MKQIETVIQPISSAIQFDNKVNKLLSEGWELKRRMITDTLGDISESFNMPLVKVLYAELEKHEHSFEEITL